jgi:hypothetical protein
MPEMKACKAIFAFNFLHYSSARQALKNMIPLHGQLVKLHATLGHMAKFID